MGLLALFGLIFGIASVVTGTGLGIYQNYSNEQSIKDTNATNLKIAQDTNASNVQQAELAYRRSLPMNQVNNLMAAGMSRQGALSALTGGGTYTAPTMQGAQMQAPMKDFSNVSAALERLQNIPANVEQASLIESQRNALAVDTQNKINEDRRAQQMHEFNIWKQGYDKNTALALDSGSSKIANALIDSGKTIEDFKDFEDMLRQLGLDKDKEIRNLNYVARQQLEDGVRSKFDNERARQTQKNQNLAANDSHLLALDTLKNSEFGRTLSSKQISKIDAEIKLLEAQYSDYLDDIPVKEKERKVREGAATLQELLQTFKINEQTFLNSIHWNEDGTPTPDHQFIGELGNASAGMNALWKMVMSIAGVDYLADVIRAISLVK